MRFFYGILIFGAFLNSSHAAEWRYRSVSDDFESTNVIEARVDDERGFSLSLQCRTEKYRGKFYVLSYTVSGPVAYYSSPVTIQLKIDDSILRYGGFAYKNSMESGYTEISNEEFKRLGDLLSQGQALLYRVTPDAGGEHDGGNTGLRGSASAISDLYKNCLTE